ncbi:hypothetical protein CERZMDRAFT_107483 [Cercospora zeae-maydis SCOH1-5]|uniref:NAD dependent epimerase/dehydratase n=1 Tax=Cercospora zeae-maydis SCOH1-5 TaxID=717836 RepID=A0A6A6F334_9PEZI|nr:hypothetical protein CERZMDRAFT_107483 [Cercospora zeae-maydis SCOH1-5]
MGAEASKPQAGAKVQVIGAGLSRTGTASFCAALEILLKGPVYHGGTQCAVSADEIHIKTWMHVLARTPYKSPTDKQFVLDKIRERTTGYVATADTPLAQFVPELLELYPDAKVICTVRDPDAWAKSIHQTSAASLQAFLGVLVYWVPCFRHFPRYVTLLADGRYGELYLEPGESQEVLRGRAVWERHIEYLRKVVPKEKLFFVDIRDGWAPLCMALGIDVPAGVEFPRINDGKAIERLAKEQIQKGLTRWAIVLGGLTAVVAMSWQFLW